MRLLETLKSLGRHLKILSAFTRTIKTHSDIPFIDAYEMRNALSHGYFKVDLDILWKTIQVNLPDLKIQIDQLVNR